MGVSIVNVLAAVTQPSVCWDLAALYYSQRLVSSGLGLNLSRG